MLYSPSVEIPPHASLSPLLPACYPLATRLLPPFPPHAVQHFNRCNTFRRGYLIFSYVPPFYTPFYHFFPFYGGKYRNYSIHSKELCFELKFNPRVKKTKCSESVEWKIRCIAPRSPHCVPSAVGTGCRWCCAIVWCNRSRWEYCSGVVPTTAPLLAVLWC